MTINQTNTLNDKVYDDAAVSAAKTSEQPIPSAAGPDYDYIVSYFKKVMKDSRAAETFAAVLFKVAAVTQTKALVLFDSIKGQNEIELNRTMAYYMNGLRSPSTLLGVQNTVRPNYYAGRNVLS